MINNNFLFSSKFADFLKSQKIADQDSFEAFKSTVTSFIDNKSNQQDFYSTKEMISNILSLLQFAHSGLTKLNCFNDSEYTYLYNGFPLEKKVSCIYILPISQGINSAIKGEFPAFDLLQLLKKEKLEWGILTDGIKWRLYSTLTSLPYENFLEIDFSDREDSNFKVFWQLFSLQLFLPDDNDVTPLEKYIEESEKEAKVIEDHIKKNIDEILEKICFGFLTHAGKDQQPLNEKEKSEYFNNAIFLLFRFLFVFYAESRNLLPVQNPKYYKISLNGLLEMARERLQSGNYDLNGTDMWDSFRDLCFYIDQGNSELGIPEYDGGLFDSVQHGFLTDSNNKLENPYFIQIITLLGFYTKRGTEQKIEYKDLSVRTLGSLYEGILEYQLFIADEQKVVRGKKIIPATIAGNIKRTDRVIEKGHVYFSQAAEERHKTGSYYTPEDVVNYMVQNSVRLGLEERWIDFLPRLKKFEIEIKNSAHEDISKGLYHKLDQELLQFIDENILSFKVIDPAMGSGHFLVNVLNTITHFILETLQTDVIISDGPIKHDKIPIDVDLTILEHVTQNLDLTPSSWRRKVVEKCIFGIDLNPLATELAKLSLWIASAAEGKPLTFLDHHLKCGDSIMGVRLQDIMVYPRETNINEQINISEYIDTTKIDLINDKFQHFLSTSSEQIQDVNSKKDEYHAIEEDPFLNHLKDIATLWLMLNFDIKSTKKKTNDIFAEKSISNIVDEKTYNEYLLKAQTTNTEPEWKSLLGDIYQEIKNFQKEKSVFHWELEFPEIINNGYEAAIGNPPYVDVTEHAYAGVPLQCNLSKNLYAYIPERAFNHLHNNQYLSFITPMAIICSKRMIHIQNIFKKHRWWLMNVDSASNPGMLFDTVKTSLNIFSLKKNRSNEIFTTNYLRFYSEDRKNLFKKCKYYKLKNHKLILGYTIPKISSDIEEQILDIIISKGVALSNYLIDNDEDGNDLYYRSAGNPYYRLAFDNPQYLDVNGEKVVSTSQKSIRFKSNFSPHILATTFYSTLYYWFWTVYSDCFNFHPKDLNRFPLDIENLTRDKLEFEKSYTKIWEDLLQNSEDVVYNKAKGITKYKLFRARRSKKIFDQVDRFLGDKLGFSDEMIDFLINYDIKYRTD